MYKDKDKQREANRVASQKRRQGMTQEGMTQDNVIPLYAHDLTVREILELHSQRTQDRFPNIPLPFGHAYYTALSEQKVKHA